MSRPSSLCKMLMLALAMQWTSAFVVPQHRSMGTSVATMTSVRAHPTEDSTPPESTTTPMMQKIGQIATTAAVALATSPLMVLAEEAAADEYEYGAVNAPISIACQYTHVLLLLSLE